MWKKLSCAALALVCALGLSGCGLTPSEPTHQHAFASTWSHDDTYHWYAATCGHDEVKDKAAHIFGDDGRCTVCDYRKQTQPSGPSQPQYEVGDPVSEDTRQQLDAALRAQIAAMKGELGGTAAGGFAVTTVTEQAFRGEGAFTAEGEGDLLVAFGDPATYALAFVRGEKAYFDVQAWPAGTEQTLPALMQAYIAGGGVLNEVTEDTFGDPQSSGLAVTELLGEGLPLMSKLAKNSLVYAAEDAVKAEEGFTMTVSFTDTLDKVLSDVQTAFETLKGNPAILGPGTASIKDLLLQPTLKGMLGDMLYGLTAQEFISLAGYFLTADQLSILPAPSDMGALDYVYSCLDSPELARALIDLIVSQSGGDIDVSLLDPTHGIGGTPIGLIWPFLVKDENGNGKNFDRDEIVANIQTLRDGLKSGDIVQDYLPGTEGSFSAVMTARFDDDCALTGLDIDIKAEGIKGTLTGETLSGDFSLDLTLAARLVPAETVTLTDITGIATKPYEPAVPDLPTPPETEEGSGEGAPAAG